LNHICGIEVATIWVDRFQQSKGVNQAVVLLISTACPQVSTSNTETKRELAVILKQRYLLKEVLA
jgi:hypothetical protein